MLENAADDTTRGVCHGMPESTGRMGGYGQAGDEWVGPDTPLACADADVPCHHPEINLGKRCIRMLDDCAELTMIVRVQCPASCCDLTGTSVCVTGIETGEKIEVPLVRFNGVENETDEFCVRTGSRGGNYTWVARYGDGCVVSGGIVHEPVEHACSFPYRPHTVSLAVWDIPSVTEGDGSTTVKVGARCNGGCVLADAAVEICDPAGVLLARTALGADPWPGTEGLHWAELSFEAPETTGVYTYIARCVGAKGHAEAQTSFTFGVSSRASTSLALRLMDTKTGEPVPDAAVAIGSRVGRTDERGLVELPVPSGKVTVCVSAEGYKPLRETFILAGGGEVALKLTPKIRYAQDY